MIFLMSKKTHNEIIELKDKEIIKLKKEIEQLERNRKVSKGLIEKNRKERKKHLDNLNATIELLTETNNILNDSLNKKTDENKQLQDNLDIAKLDIQEKSKRIENLKADLKHKNDLLDNSNKNLQEARDEIVRISKLIKPEKKTYSEVVAYTGLKREKKGSK